MPVSRRHTRNSNLRRDQTVAVATKTSNSRDQFVNCQDALIKMIRQCWPEKTAQNLSIIGDMTVRQAERLLARQRKISFEVFCLLLQHEQHGRKFHWALLNSLTSAWSVEDRHERETAELERERARLDRRIEQMKRARFS